MTVATIVGLPKFGGKDCSELDDVLVVAPAVATEVHRASDDLDRQLSRLDVENGDILVVRTRSKLKPEAAAKWQEQLQLLCRSQGVRDVSVIVLDDCTDLTIERPGRPDTRMQHQVRPAPPIITR